LDSASSHRKPPRIGTWASGRSVIMKSMNSGTPASVALPDRSSFGMMMLASTATVAHSCALKNFGLYALLPTGRGRLGRRGVLVRLCIGRDLGEADASLPQAWRR
jgi:hypothetical protein